MTLILRSLPGHEKTEFESGERTDPLEFLSRPHRRPLYDSAAWFVWQSSNNSCDPVRDKGFERYVREVARTKSLTIRLIESLCQRWKEQQVDARRSRLFGGSEPGEPAKPAAPSRDELASSLENLDDQQIEELLKRTKQEVVRSRK